MRTCSLIIKGLHIPSMPMPLLTGQHVHVLVKAELIHQWSMQIHGAWAEPIHRTDQPIAQLLE